MNQMNQSAEKEVLEWRVFPARRQPGRAVAVVAVALAAGAWAYVLLGSLLLAAVAAGLLLASVGEFLFPVVYRLTPEQAEARNPFAWRRIAWAQVRRVALAEDAILLSPLAEPSRRDAFRGVLLRCAANRQEVLTAVRRYRDAAAGR